MQVLSSSGLLNLWERGHALHPLDKGLLALSVALSAEPPETLADWPLGSRNRALAELHCSCFGSTLQAWTSCPRCGEKMEFETDARKMLTGEEDQNHVGTIEVNGRSFRLPTSRDLAELARETDPHAAAMRLAERCRLSGESCRWSEEELEQVGERMALADPMAETRLALRCPSCSNEWDETLDIASFLWAEIEARAKQLLWEVHTLASAYGWTEKEVLSLSGARRARYMEMVRA